MSLAKKYKSISGAYLRVCERDNGYAIGWYDPEEEDFDLYIGEIAYNKFPADKREWEDWIAYWAILPFAKKKDRTGFLFKTKKEAKLALRVATLALMAGVTWLVPWPEWAIQAIEAGWTPPKCWKP